MFVPKHNIKSMSYVQLLLFRSILSLTRLFDMFLFRKDFTDSEANGNTVLKMRCSRLALMKYPCSKDNN